MNVSICSPAVNCSMEAEDFGGPRQLELWEVVMWYSLYGLICLLAVIGNTVVIYIILTRSHMRNPTNYFIANLALADAISGLVGIPMRFNAAMLQRWVFPNVLCHVMPFIESLTLTVSVLTLCAIAVDRFRSVVFFRLPALSACTIVLIILCTWIFSISCTLPYGLCHSVGLLNFERGWFPPVQNYTDTMLKTNGSFRVCFPLHNDEIWWKVYNIYLTIATYFIPLVLIDGAYAFIGYRVYESAKALAKAEAQSCKESGEEMDDERAREFQKSKERVLKLLVMVVIVFTFCWLPYEMYLLLSEVLESINEYREIQTVFFAIHWLAMSNSCLNPIIYGIYNEKFQREYKTLLLRLTARASNHSDVGANGQVLVNLMAITGSVTGLNEVSPRLPPVQQPLLPPPQHRKKMSNSIYKGHEDMAACGNYIANELGFD